MILEKCKLEEAVAQILRKVGATEEEAAIVAEELVTADMMKVNSHGVLRVPQYLGEIEDKLLEPNANIKIVKETEATAVVDGDFGFGQVVAKKMVDIACEKAQKTGIACVLSVNTRHIGRVGSFVERIAEKGLIGFVTVGVYGTGPMAPWGAKESRLSTNPIAWAAPREGEDTVFMDGATTVVAEGKLRAYILEGKDIPEGWVKDANGNDTTNPRDLYGPPKGTLYPLGGKNGGAKGSGLALMANLFSIALNNEEYWTAFENGGVPRSNNSVFMVAVDPEFFCGRKEYYTQVKAHCDYIKSAKPAEGFSEVLVPGEFEHRNYAKSLKEGVIIPDDTWSNLIAIGQKHGCAFCEGMEKVDGLKNSVQFQ